MNSMAQSSCGKSITIHMHRPGLKEGIFFFVSGILGSVSLTIFVDQFADSFLASLPDFYATLIAAVILAPFIEEFSKAFPLFYRHGETRKSIFILAILVGLGFGIFEFMTYVFVLGVPIIPRLSGIFFHAASTSITAYGIGINRTFPFYLVAVSLHGSHNFFASVVGPSFVNSAGVNMWLIGAIFPVAIAMLCSLYLYNRIGSAARAMLNNLNQKEN